MEKSSNYTGSTQLTSSKYEDQADCQAEDLESPSLKQYSNMEYRNEESSNGFPLYQHGSWQQLGDSEISHGDLHAGISDSLSDLNIFQLIHDEHPQEFNLQQYGTQESYSGVDSEESRMLKTIIDDNQLRDHLFRKHPCVKQIFNRECSKQLNSTSFKEFVTRCQWETGIDEQDLSVILTGRMTNQDRSFEKQSSRKKSPHKRCSSQNVTSAGKNINDQLLLSHQTQNEYDNPTDSEKLSDLMPDHLQ